MDDDELLNSIVRQHINQSGCQARNIGKVFDAYVKKGLRRHRRQVQVVDLWKEILPAELAKHCRPVSLLGGVLKIEAEAGVYMFEIQSARQALLEQLQRECPGAGIDSIKLVGCEVLKESNEKEQQKRVKV